MSKLSYDLLILALYCDTHEIPNVLKGMTAEDVLDNFEEIEEQLVAEYLVYGGVEL